MSEELCSHCKVAFSTYDKFKHIDKDTGKEICSICYNQQLCIILGSKKAAADYAASAIR